MHTLHAARAGAVIRREAMKRVTNSTSARLGAQALLSAYALYKLAPCALQAARAARNLLQAAEDFSRALAHAARDTRLYLELRNNPDTSSPGAHGRGLDIVDEPPRALTALLGALATPDALRILATVTEAAVRATLPLPSHRPITAHGFPQQLRTGEPAHLHANQAAHPHISLRALDGVLRALDSPHGRKVTEHAVSAASKSAVQAVAALQPGIEDGAVNPLDRLLDAALSERGRALVLDALAVVVRAAVPALLTAHARAPDTKRNTNNTPGAVERVLTRALRDRALVRDVVRVAATEAVRAYLITSARRGLTPSPSPNTNRRLSMSNSTPRRTPTTLPSTPSARAPEPPALWRTVGQAAATAARRWLLRAARDNAQPSWIVF